MHNSQNLTNKLYIDYMNKKKIFIWIVVILLAVFSASVYHAYQGRYCYDNYFRNMYHFYRYDAFRAEPNYDVSCPLEFKYIYTIDRDHF